MSDPLRPPEVAGPSPWPWRALALAAAGGLLLLLWSVWDREAVLAWKRDAAPIPFFAAMALLPALGLPMTPFFVLAGATFGSRPAMVGSLLALGTNLILCYSLSQTGVRTWLEGLFRRFGYELPNFQEQGRSAVRFTLMVKFTPGLPAVVKNYVLGFAGVPFPLYFGVSMLITGVYAASFIMLGDSLLQHDLSRAVAPAAVLVAGGGILWWWRRRHRTVQAHA